MATRVDFLLEVVVVSLEPIAVELLDEGVVLAVDDDVSVEVLPVVDEAPIDDVVEPEFTEAAVAGVWPPHAVADGAPPRLPPRIALPVAVQPAPGVDVVG